MERGRNGFSGQTWGCVRVDQHGFWLITLAKSRDVWLALIVALGGGGGFEDAHFLYCTSPQLINLLFKLRGTER